METLEFFFDIDGTTVQTWLFGGVVAVAAVVISFVLMRRKSARRQKNWREAGSRIGLELETTRTLFGSAIDELRGRYRNRNLSISRRQEELQTSDSSLRDVDGSMIQTSDRAARKRRRHRQNRDDTNLRRVTVFDVDLDDDRWQQVGLQAHRYGAGIADDGDPLESRYNLYGTIPDAVEAALRSDEGLEVLKRIQSTFDNFELEGGTATFEVFDDIQEPGRLVLTADRAVDLAEALEDLADSDVETDDASPEENLFPAV